MASRYAVASGNWSNTATWNGGTLPEPGDTVRPSGYTVVIDQDINVGILTNNASAPATAGGSFQITSTGTINIISNIEGRYVGNVVRILGTNCIVNVIGNLNQYTPLINATTSYCISIEVTCTFTHTGNATGGLNSANYGPTTGCIRCSSGTPTLNLTGVYTGGTAQALSPNPAIFIEGGVPSINLIGSVIGGNTPYNPSIFFANTGVSGYLMINGTITSSISCAIIVTIVAAGGYTPILVSGQINNVNGVNAIYAPAIKLLKDASTIWTYQTNDSLSNEVLYTADSLTGYPPGAKVEKDYIFGPSDEFIGELDPVNIDVQQLAIELLSEISSSTLPIAERLRNVSTVETTGTQLSSLI